MTANADIPAGDGERRHDPLCERPNGPNFAMCYCDVIARVREDMRDQLFPLRWGRAEQLETARVNGWHAGWNAAREEFYAAALRDAVAAVKAALTDDDGYVRQSELDDALAAIEALGGER